MLQITKLFTVFEVFDRAEDAAAAFSKAAGTYVPSDTPEDSHGGKLAPKGLERVEKLPKDRLLQLSAALTR